MLDLSTLKNKYYELKMFDGEVLRIERPSQKMVIEMMGYEDKLKDLEDKKGILDAFIDTLFDILNNNVDGKKFTKKWIAESFDFSIGMALVEDYMQFVSKINSDPN